MTEWVIVFLVVCGIVCVWQLWWTRQHARNLDRHEREMARIRNNYRGGTDDD